MTAYAFTGPSRLNRSGEWMTVNLARKAGITVIPVDLGCT